MTNFSKLATLFILGSFSFSAYSLDITNERDLIPYFNSLKANVERVQKYKEFLHIFDIYSKSDKKIEDIDYEPLSNATESMAFNYETSCFISEQDILKKVSPKFASWTIPARLLYFEMTEARFDQCINVRLSMLMLSNKVAIHEINSDFAKEITKIKEVHNKSLELLYSEFKNNIDDLRNGQSPRFSKISKYRELAKNDVIAQVLNYASGSPEDASGASFFYPEDISNGKCIYKIAFDKSDLAASYASELSTAMNKIGAITGIKELSSPDTQINNSIDINKADWKNLNFYNLKGSKKNKFTGAVAYLRFQSRVEGLPDFFECDSNSCNVERLKRGWGLVQTKCPGIKKAF